MPVGYRSLPPAIAAAAVAIAALAGCGGSSGKDAQALLRRGFAASIPSANVTVDLSAKVDGVPQLSQPIRVKLGGPYRSNGSGKLPSLNWDISLSGGGQTFSAGVISTGTQAFVNFQGTNYKVSDATVARLNASAAQRSPTGSRSLKSFGIDPLAWVKNPSEEGDSDVAGVATTHVSAGIDVAKLFNDLNKVVARAGGSVGAARPQQLTPQIIDQIKKVVHDPKFDVYVGKRDGKIRRIALSLSFDVPKQAQTTSRGVSGGNLTLSVEFAGVRGAADHRRSGQLEADLRPDQAARRAQRSARRRGWRTRRRDGLGPGRRRRRLRLGLRRRRQVPALRAVPEQGEAERRGGDPALRAAGQVDRPSGDPRASRRRRPRRGRSRCGRARARGRARRR